MAPLPEEIAFQRFRETGDPAAMAQVFDRTAPKLLLVAMHFVRDAAEAEDLVQTTFLQAIAAAPAFDPSRPLLPWLTSILANRARDLVRSRARRPRHESGVTEQQSRERDPLAQTLDAEVMEQVTRAIDALPEPHRHVLVLRLVHGLKAIEVAHALGQAPGTVRMQLKRALVRLRRELPKGLVAPAVLWVGPRRGLAAVRHEVLATLPLAGAGAVLVLGGALMLKKALLVVAVVLAASTAWLWLAQSESPSSAAGAAPAPAGLAHAPNQEPRAETAAAPSDSAPAPQERQRVDTPSEPGPASEAPHWVVRVVDTKGEPVRDASVFVCDPDWGGPPGDAPDAARERTDPEGAVRFRDLAPSQRLLVVAAPGHLPVQERLLPPGEQLVSLTGGLALAGTVRVAGSEPPVPIELVVSGFRDPTADWCAAARKALRSVGLGDSRLRATTGESGRFAVFGLPHGEVVKLTVPELYRLAQPEPGNDPRSVMLTTIASNVLLDLVRLPVLTGRPVRTEDTRKGSGGLMLLSGPDGTTLFLSDPVLVRYRFQRRGGSTRDGEVWCSAGSTFTIPFHETDVVDAEVTLVRNDRAVMARRQAGRPLAESFDFGEIRFPESPRMLRMRFTDLEGLPVAGARARAGRRVSEASDARGETQLEVLAMDREILVGAFGFALRRHAVPEPAPDPWVIALERSSLLHLRVRAPDGGPLRGLVIKVEEPVPAGDDPDSFMSFGDVRGQVHFGAEWSHRWRLLRFDLAPGGVFSRSGFPENAPIKISLEDRHGHLLRGPESVMLQRGEVRELEWTLSQHSRSAVGRIIGPDGAVLQGAQAQVVSGTWSRRGTVVTDGVFRIEDIWVEEPEVELSCDGYVSVRVKGKELFEQRDYRLERGRTLWVEVVDMAGKRTTATIEFEPDGGGSYRAHERGPGMYQLEGIPARSGVVRAQQRAGAERVGADDARVKLTLVD